MKLSLLRALLSDVGRDVPHRMEHAFDSLRAEGTLGGRDVTPIELRALGELASELGMGDAYIREAQRRRMDHPLTLALLGIDERAPTHDRLADLCHAISAAMYSSLTRLPLPRAIHDEGVGIALASIRALVHDVLATVAATPNSPAEIEAMTKPLQRQLFELAATLLLVAKATSKPNEIEALQTASDTLLQLERALHDAATQAQLSPAHAPRDRDLAAE